MRFFSERDGASEHHNVSSETSRSMTGSGHDHVRSKRVPGISPHWEHASFIKEVSENLTEHEPITKFEHTSILDSLTEHALSSLAERELSSPESSTLMGAFGK
ncbi:MAG: hypothetical protein ACREXR_24125 [Gammaproteobacteria bacterium]